MDVITVGESHFGVYHCVADTYGGCAADGLTLIVADHLIDGVVHVMGVLTAGGGRKKSVLEQSAGEGYGREKVRIFTFIHKKYRQKIASPLHSYVNILALKLSYFKCWGKILSKKF